MIESHAQLAGAVSALAPPCFVFGGVAEDALLDGRVTRPHGDVDVMVPRADLPLRLEQFATLGYTDWETWLADSQGRPQVLHSSTQPVDLEVSIIDGEPGAYTFELTAPDGRRLHLLLPADSFDFSAVSLDGIPVQTLSPLALYSLRVSLAASGAFGGFRPHDAPVQERLRELVGAVPPADLEPRLKPA